MGGKELWLVWVEKTRADLGGSFVLTGCYGAAYGLPLGFESGHACFQK